MTNPKTKQARTSQPRRRLTANSQNGGIVLNDVHAQVSATRAAGVQKPSSKNELISFVQQCSSHRRQIAVTGSKFAMGRQQFATDAWTVDLSHFANVTSVDETNGIAAVQGGCCWTDLRDYLRHTQSDWEVHQKQSGADALTIAGSLSVNAHGNVTQSGPVSSDVAWLKLVNHLGEEIYCSRDVESELFGLVLGGIGLIGIISEIGLRLVRKQYYVRYSRVATIEDWLQLADSNWSGNSYADMQLEIDPASARFLERGVLNRWQAKDDGTDACSDSATKLDWKMLIALAHVDKQAAFSEYSKLAKRVSGRTETRDNIFWDSYTKGYHEVLEHQLGLPSGGDVLAEFFVRLSDLPHFLAQAKQCAIDYDIDLILATLRQSRACEVSVLRWAKESYTSIVFAMHMDHHSDQVNGIDCFCAEVAKFAVDRGGSFYLPYRCYWNEELVLAAYPQVRHFLAMKSKYDPTGTFTSDWYRQLLRCID